MADYGLKQFFADKVTDTSATALHSLGIIRFEGNKEYRYVQVVDAAAGVGDSLNIASTADGIVSPDRSGGSQVAALTLGVAQNAIASGYYGWVLKKGIGTVECDGGVVTGDGLVPHAASDGIADTCDVSTVSTNTAFTVFGFALAQDNGSTATSTCTAFIDCP